MRKSGLLVCLLLLSGVLFAQKQLLTGIVKDSSGTPLPSVSVSVKGTGSGTTTNNTGAFSLQVKKGDIIEFGSVGYSGYRYRVGNESVLNVVLNKSDQALNTVVITALGIKRESKSLGYSAQTISGNDVVKADAPNIANGLIGKSAGLNVTIPNGVEGSSSRVVIRGNNSLYGNNQALIVVDGVIVDNEQILPGGVNLSNAALLGNKGGGVNELAQKYN